MFGNLFFFQKNICTKHVAECAHALISGALFYNQSANGKFFPHYFQGPTGALTFTPKQAEIAIDNVSWYWVNGEPATDGSTMQVDKTKDKFDMVTKLEEFYTKSGNTLASNSFKQDRKPNKFLVVINKYKSNEESTQL